MREEFKHVSKKHLVSMLTSAADDLNGTNTSLAINKIESKKALKACIQILSEMLYADATLKKDPTLQPVFEALSTVQDLNDALDVAEALKNRHQFYLKA